MSMRQQSRRQFLLGALERYEQLLTAYAMRLVGGDVHLAHDAVQHTFTQLCKRPQREIEHKLAPWLYTVCRNFVRDEFKSAFRNQSQFVAESFESIDQNAIDPASQLEQEDFLAKLRSLFDTLQPNERDVIELWSHGFNSKEIGEILEMKSATVRVNLHRAIKRLQSHPHVTQWLERATSQSVRSDATTSISGNTL